jgi:hypothetical protein
MKKVNHLLQNHRLVAVLLLFVVLAALATGAATAGAAFLDGGGFPTATPTATLAPTAAPTQTPTNIALDSIFPTQTPSLVVPYPVEQFLGADAIEPQAATAESSSSPSLILVALPFLGAFLLLALIVGNWLRRSRG